MEGKKNQNGVLKVGRLSKSEFLAIYGGASGKKNDYSKLLERVKDLGNDEVEVLSFEEVAKMTGASPTAGAMRNIQKWLKENSDYRMRVISGVKVVAIELAK